MILRRVIAHFRKQEWTAIGLDFLIVVIGVFVGIQVSNYNDVRKERDLAGRAIIKLKQDFVEISREATIRTEFHMQRIKLLQGLIHCLVDECDAAQLDRVVPEAVATGGSFYTVPPRSSTYSEMVSAGRVNLIANEELRFALFRYDVSLTGASMALGRINDIALLYDRDMKQHTLLDPSSFVPPTVDNWDWKNDDFAIHSVLPPIGAYDWEAMKADKRFRRAADELLRMQTYYAGNHAEALRDCEKIIQLLEAQS